MIFDVASNGTRIIETIINNRTYKSEFTVKCSRRVGKNIFSFIRSGITGSTIKIDSNGDSEGNFSVLALKAHPSYARDNVTCEYTMIPVAYFQEGEKFPVSESWF